MSKKIYDIINDKYELCYKEDLTDISGLGVVLKHKKSGARVCLVQNDDNNKVFLVGFRTPPSDSTGVPHIIEHTVLCGSKKYPVKDPFIELAKGSLNTFLNAMTFPDRTLYPVASCNDKDIKNLSDVYMDAVFNPNIYHFEQIFKQEGWRYELASPEDELTINGVVYNEMKGAYSSPEDVLEYKTMQAMFPSVTYGLSSGGDPDVIPELTYEAYLDFHKKYYHPSNSYIYLYGDFDFEERLDWLASEYLDAYDTLEVDSKIGFEKPQEGIKYVTDAYSITDEEDDNNKAYLSLNAVMNDVLDVKNGVAWDVITYVLFGAPGAPVKQALLDAGIGKDVWASFQNYIRQSFFNICAKDTDAKLMDKFEAVIRENLEKQVREGLSKEALLGAINTMEFSYIEGDTGSYPRGLVLAFSMFTSWLYDDDQAFVNCHKRKIFEELRAEIDNGYFEKLIQEDLLDNKNIVMHALVPEKGLNVKKEAELAKKLADYKDSLSSEEIDKLVEDTKSLKAYQESEDSEEAKKTLPVLRVSDVKKEAVSINTSVNKFGKINIISHDEKTNGISYIKLMFDIEDIKPEYYSHVSLLATILSKRLDTELSKLADLSTQIDIYTGGISFAIHTQGVYKNRKRVKLYMAVITKVFTENTEKALKLIKEIITKTIFDDKKRIKEIIGEKYSGMEMVMLNAGHRTAISRAKSYFSPIERTKQALSGIDMFYFLKDLYDNFDEKADEFIDTLKSLSKEIFTADKLFADITSEEEGVKALEAGLSLITDDIKQARDEKTYFGAESEEFVTDAKNEAFKISGQIQYAASAGNYIEAGVEYNGAFCVAKTILAYDYLWTNVRVLGGAYGCMFDLEEISGNVGFVSYRDPNLSETYNVFKKAAEYFANIELTDEEVEKYIIGTMSNKDMPKNASMLGDLAMGIYLAEYPVELLQKERDEILSADVKAIRSIAGLLDAAANSGYICTVGSETAVEKDKDLFNTISRF